MNPFQDSMDTDTSAPNSQVSYNGGYGYNLNYNNFQNGQNGQNGQNYNGNQFFSFQSFSKPQLVKWVIDGKLLKTMVNDSTIQRFQLDLFKKSHCIILNSL